MSSTPGLILAAAGVGFGHAVLPDHWVPLALVGRTQRLPLTRVARLSMLAGVAHVAVSILLGAVVIAVGLPLRHRIEHAQNLIIGGLLILTGIGFALLELLGKGHTHGHGGNDHHHSLGEHHHHHHGDHHHGERSDIGHGRDRFARLTGIMVPFGAAASPDLTILPVFLAATVSGPVTAGLSLVAFGFVTVVTILALTVTAAAGGYTVQGAWLDRFGNLVTAAVLLTVGGLVAAGVL